MISSKYTALLSFLVFFIAGQAQITAGKITFERRTNLMKKFKDERSNRWLNENNKNAIDIFELYFNDSLSVFLPVEDESKKGMMSWATNRNTVSQNIKTGSRLSILNIWGENAYVQDSLINRQWKITESKRKIGTYECRKAIYQMNDSIRIYAWFSEEIVPSVGPETFRGLPGAILGLATEDGGVVYFAKKVEVMKPDFTKITPKVGKKVYTHQELKTKLEADFAKEPWGRGMVQELFMW